MTKLRIRSLATTTLAVLLLLVAATPVSARAGGTIEGVVVHGVDAAPVPDLEVTLQRVEEGEETQLAGARTDAEGRFVFEEVAHGADLEVALTYDDARYRSGALTVAPDEVTTVDLAVFDSTEAADDVVVTSWVVWVDRLNGVSVQHDLQVDNRGQRTYLGVEPDGGGERAVIAVPLEPDAVGLRFLGRFTGCCATMRGTDYVHTAPLPPGTTAGTLRYAVESLDTLTLPARLPVESFTMMVPAGVRVGTSQLQLSGEIESQGNTYDVYTSDGLAAGEVLEVSLRGLSVPSTPTWQLALAAVAAVGLGLGAVLWWRRRSTARSTARPEAAASRPGGAAPLPPELLVEELALLDVGFERGLLAREAYDQLRAARKAELVARGPSAEG